VAGRRTIDGFSALTLSADSPDDLEATFVPDAGMVGCSLRHRGEELLGQRGGLRAYAGKRSTMGIPLLHPWANVLSEQRFSVAGGEVDLERGSPAPHIDEHGLPIHGLLSGARGWRVSRHEATDGGGTLEAGFDFDADTGLMASFPFPHTVAFEAVLSTDTLTITTTVRPSGDAPVPISFGYHPYFQLPGVPRSEWEIEIPVAERLTVDPRMLPTGERERIQVEAGPLGARTFDDLYVAPAGGAPFVLAGGGRRIELSADAGYPFAQVYAPADDDVIAYEPMTAPINALIDGGADLRVVEPGDGYEATFSITVRAQDH